MKNRIIVLATLAALISAPALADPGPVTERDKRTMGIGLAAGGTIGALLGGPPGAFAGILLAGLGTDLELTTRRSEGHRQEALALAAERRSLLSERVSMKAQLGELNRMLEHERALATETDIGLMADGLEFAVAFRTNSAVPPEEASEGLAALAALVAAVPSLEVHLDGYADPRGGDRHNQALSRARAETIREMLVDAGVDGQRIHVHAHGATSTIEPGQQADPDGWALQRRVGIRIESREGRLAANP